MNENKNLDLLIKIGVFVGILVTIFLLYINYPFLKTIFSKFFGALLPFIIALVIAVLVEPTVSFFENKCKFKRGLAVLFSLLLFFGLILFILILLSSRLIIEMVELSENISNYSDFFLSFGLEKIGEIRSFISSDSIPLGIKDSIEDNASGIVLAFKNIIAGFVDTLVRFLGTLPLVFTIAIVTFVASFFISKDKEEIVNFGRENLTLKVFTSIDSLFKEMSSALVGFLRAQIFLISFTGIQVIIGLLILRVEYAFTLGIVVALFDLIPILGPGTIFVPWIIMNFIIGNYSLAIGLSILYIIITGVRQAIEPKIVSQNIGLHPLATLMAIFMGLRLFGVLGLILGPIILIIIKSILKTKKEGAI